MECLYIKSKIYFGERALDRLADYHGKAIWFVCDRFLANNGSLVKLLERLDNSCRVGVFSDVVPDPPVEVVGRGVSAFLAFRPDIVIAFGGGSAIDTAKGILGFVRNQRLGPEVILVAIPTTSGTGSEVTNVTVLTDTQSKSKLLMRDDSLLPEEAILDTSLTVSVPPDITANTGMDVLVHALEAYVAVSASNFSDALAQKAMELVMQSLIPCFRNGEDKENRTRMHEASALAGMAFNAAGLGINHGLAHQLGGMFHIPHGLANAILLRSVIRFNSKDIKSMRKYAMLARYAGLVQCGASNALALNMLCAWVSALQDMLGMPKSLREYGIAWCEYEKARENMAREALQDASTQTNPITPTFDDLLGILDSIC